MKLNPLSLFARAKKNVHSRNVDPSQQPAGLAGAITREANEMIAAAVLPPVRHARQSAPATRAVTSTIQRPAVAAVPACEVTRAAGDAGKFALEDSGKLADLVSRPTKIPANDLKRYKAELELRGFSLVDQAPATKFDEPRIRVQVSRDHFDSLPHSTRNAIMASGGIIAPSGRRAGETPLEVSSMRKITYPIQPTEGPSWQQFMAYSSDQVKAYAKQTANDETGLLSRIHIFNAYASLGSGSWRYAGESSAQRTAFYEKFKESLGHCSKFGPRQESPNDPAPPLTSNQMTASDYLTLPEVVKDRMRALLPAKASGRICRAELKRACELASPTMQEALLAAGWTFYLQGPMAFEDEWIWPANYTRK